ncbi:DUF4974 domain-containing protein [Seonamhaeicola marinus]|uniref:DUF4974 domain-containing protein n=1 Tax=Seonamhaeicola marinus TaxID=1912246 RepID=A0A5D0J7W1_9FLAO|nr:DUF4974 domain-containing protein [Seonamhaeicola marinus]
MFTKDQEIEVLGTVFNVSSYPDDTNHFVVLKSGSVKLKSGLLEKRKLLGNKYNERIITPGTKANFNLKNHLITEKQVNVEDYFAWINGVLIVKNDDLEHITKRLSRYYNVSISIENDEIKEETFSGYLDLKENIVKVLDVLKESTKLNYQIDDTNNINININ